jgi:2-iminoacetate synthase ThiH
MVRIDGQGDGRSLIQVRGIDKTYQRGSEEIHVLQGLNLNQSTRDWYTHAATSARSSAAIFSTSTVTAGS